MHMVNRLGFDRRNSVSVWSEAFSFRPSPSFSFNPLRAPQGLSACGVSKHQYLRTYGPFLASKGLKNLRQIWLSRNIFKGLSPTVLGRGPANKANANNLSIRLKNARRISLFLDRVKRETEIDLAEQASCSPSAAGPVKTGPEPMGKNTAYRRLGDV